MITERLVYIYIWIYVYKKKNFIVSQTIAFILGNGEDATDAADASRLMFFSAISV